MEAKDVSMKTLRVGDKVTKFSGSSEFVGRVVSIFANLAGETRIVVECEVPEVRGLLHIYSPSQMELVEAEQPMSEGTLLALKMSIAKWRKMESAPTLDEVNIGSNSCALCHRHNRNRIRENSIGGVDFSDFPYGPNESSRGCEGCPVMKASGNESCTGTPYEDAAKAFQEWKGAVSSRNFDDVPGAKVAFRAAAKAEADFLTSLLPRGEVA
jgi:hypothetical protein